MSTNSIAGEVQAISPFHDNDDDDDDDDAGHAEDGRLGEDEAGLHWDWGSKLPRCCQVFHQRQHQHQHQHHQHCHQHHHHHHHCHQHHHNLLCQKSRRTSEVAGYNEHSHKPRCVAGQFFLLFDVFCFLYLIIDHWRIIWWQHWCTTGPLLPPFHLFLFDIW